MVVWLFPGQGSQRRGMGGELFDRYPEQVAAADAELGYPIARLCRDDPDDQLRDTAYAQPALFVVGALSSLDQAASGPPSFVAGHSLGEYAALFAAGCFDFATGVRLVRRRGELMSRARGGGMLAVVRAPVEAVTELLRSGGHDDVDVANHNAPDQVVLSGPTDALRTVAAELADRRLGRAVPLRVSAAFHSRYLADARREFGEFLAGVTLADPQIPVLSNVTARPHRAGEVARRLVDQICAPVRWSDSMRYLLDQGVEEAVELGPGTVLTELWRANRRSYQPARRRPAEPAADSPPQPATTPQPAINPPPATTAPQPATTAPAPGSVAPESLGSADFRRDYRIRYAYLTGSMYQAIASTDLVLRMGRAGLMGFFGTGGLPLDRVEDAIATFQRELGVDGRYGMNLLCMLDNPDLERAIVDTYLKRGVRYVEAAAYPQLTPALVRWRYSGAHRDPAGRPVAVNRVLAKVSRPEVATAFMSPAPDRMLAQLVAAGDLTASEAEVAAALPVSDDICVESDSGGHTDAGVALTLLPAMLRLRDDLATRHAYPGRIRIGAAGGLGAPHALAAAFVLGADFVVTGSVNQCSPEAGTSAATKDLLAALDVQDTGYAPAGDLFELGAQVQVVRKGTLFPVRANKLYQVYRRYGSLDEIDERTRRTIEDEYFGRSFARIWAESREYLARRHPAELARAERDPRHRMAVVFRWYFRHSTTAALRGDPAERVNYQIHCGPAMGAFNRWVAGTDLTDWRARHVDVIAERLMTGTADLLRDRFAALTATNAGPAQH